MAYVLEKKLSPEQIEKVVEETKAIRKLRDSDTLVDDKFFYSELNGEQFDYMVVDPLTNHFLSRIVWESVFDNTIGRYLFYFQDHYYFFSIHSTKNETLQKAVMFYQETPPPKSPIIYQQLIDELKQAFLCGGGIELEGWDCLRSMEDVVRKDILTNERTSIVLILKVLDELDDMEKTNHNFR